MLIVGQYATGGGLFTFGLTSVFNNINRIQMRRRGERPPTRYDPETGHPTCDDEAEQIVYSVWLMLVGVLLMVAAVYGITVQNDDS